MAETSFRNRRWKTLNSLTKQLFEGEVDLEELVNQSENPAEDALLDHGALKKRKRSPRNNNNNKPAEAGLKIKIKNPLKQQQKNPNSRNPSSACKKKKKKECFEEQGERSTYKLLMKRQIINDDVVRRPTPVPEAVERRIVESGGRLESAVVLIEKELYPTDLSRKHCRMSVPIRQVRERFLFAEEVEFLSSGGKIRTVVVPPSPGEEECEISFSLWKSNTTYVLLSGWKNVWVQNGLRDWMLVRLWAFRRNYDSQLCFALEKK